MGATGRQRKDFPAIDLAGWNWGQGFGAFTEIIGEAVDETVRAAFAEDPPGAYFGYGYRGEGDPLSLFFDVPLGEYETNNPTWEIGLRDIVQHTMRWFVTETEIDEDGAGYHREIAKSLRQLADEIDAALDTSRPPS